MIDWKSASPKPGGNRGGVRQPGGSQRAGKSGLSRRVQHGRRRVSGRAGFRFKLPKPFRWAADSAGPAPMRRPLLGLERLTGDRLDFPARHQLAAALGSDVPLFLLGGRVLGCGRGEEVYPLIDLPSRHCLVIFPGFSISTAEAYREAGLRLTEAAGAGNTGSFGAWPQFPLMSWGPAENDFEWVVFARWPELARLKRRLIRAGADVASLTGSGSAVYALFSSSRQMARASQLIPKRWLVFPTRTLERAEYQKCMCSVKSDE